MTDHDACTPDGHTCPGTHTILQWGREGVTKFLAQSSGRGRPWLVFLRKVSYPDEWWVTAYKTRGFAIREDRSWR